MVVILDGKRVKIPGSYDELKTKHYQKIVTWEESQKDKELQDKDLFSLFKILTDSKHESFADTPENRSMIWEAVRWYFETQLLVPKEPPLILQVGFKWLVFPRILDIPKNIGSLPSGQLIVMEQALKKAKYKEEILSFATAVFLQPYYDQAPFSKSRALELENIILEMPIKQIYPVGFFLLLHVEKNLIRHSNNSNLIRTSPIFRIVKRLQNWLIPLKLKSTSIT